MSASTWTTTAIRSLGEVLKGIQRNLYAQCADCGMAYQDDIPPFVADLPCPNCNAGYLNRRLEFSQLKPKTDFPQTWKPEGNDSFSQVSLQLHFARQGQLTPACGASGSVSRNPSEVNCDSCLKLLGGVTG